MIAWLAGNDTNGHTLCGNDNGLLSAGEKLSVTAIADLLGIETRTIRLEMIFHQLGGDSVPAVYDRWTLSLLLGLLDAAYAGVVLERPLPFSAFRQYLQQHRQPDELIEFWREEMSNLQPITYPEYPYPNYQPRATCRVQITAPRHASVEASPTVQIRLAWALLLSNYQGSDDVIYGTVVDGRRIGLPGVEGLFGPTLATVPCRIPIQRAKTVRESLVDIRARILAMAPF